MDQKVEEIRDVLRTVDDPELRSVSVMDLGMVRSIRVDGSKVNVMLVPTFSGCPALDIIQITVKRAIEKVEWVETCNVEFTRQHNWSSDDITDTAKANLKRLGISPPPEHYVPGEEWSVNCPYCDSTYTSMENVFGPTACRSILYCHNCKNPFEAMKPVIKQQATC